MPLVAVGADAKDVSGEQAPQLHRIDVAIRVPDAGWSLEIERVYQSSEELTVLCRVSRRNICAIQVISRVFASLKLPVENLPARVFVLGKTWNWDDDSGVIPLQQASELDEYLPKDAVCVYEPKGGSR